MTKINKPFGGRFRVILFISVTFCVLLIRATTTWAQTLSLSIYPPLLEVMAQPGRTVTQVYKLTNNSDQELQITPRIFPFKPQGENGEIKIKFLQTQEPTQKDLVFSFESGEKFNQAFRVAVGQTKELTLRIRVPRTLPENDFYYTLLFSTALSDDQHGQSTTSSVTQIGSNILITVSKFGKPTLLARILEFSTPKIIDSFSPVTFNIRLENWGKTLWKPFGKIKITGILKQKGEITLLEQNVMANSSRRLLIDPFKPHFPLGPFKAFLEFTLNETGPKLSSEIVFWYLPYKLFAAILSIIIVTILLKRTVSRDKNKT